MVYAVSSGHCGLSGFYLCGVEWSMQSPVVTVASVVSICVGGVSIQCSLWSLLCPPKFPLVSADSTAKIKDYTSHSMDF